MTITRAASRAPRATVVGAAGLAIVLAAAAYWPTLGIGFVSDDFLILQRVSELGGLQNAAAYFGLRHFEYYRPLAFLSFAGDWQLWARSAAGFHATALGLHVLNTLLVFALSRQLMGTAGALAAGALFAVHPSSHEAVIWIASRFDVLATFWVLAGLVVLRWRAWRGGTLAAAACLAAVLSKESALAFPVIAGAYLVLVLGTNGRRLLGQLALCSVSVGVYVALRQGAGLASAGGAARLPKLGALTLLVLMLLVPAQLGWTRTWSLLGLDRRRARAVLAGALALVGLLAYAGPAVGPVRRALVSVAFGAIHLTSPVMLDWAVGTLPPTMWIVGLAALVAVTAALAAGWRHLLRLPQAVFLLVFLVAALVPVSSMTEGTRYVYLATVPAAMFVGLVIDRLTRSRRIVAGVLVVLVIAVNTWQVRLKAADWMWASQMTAKASATINDALAGRCAGRDVVLITAPVRVRGVYSNLNLEGLDWLGACAPASLTTLIRVGLDDPRIEVRWIDANTLEGLATNYGGGFVASRDGRHFDVPLDPGRTARIRFPAGTLDTAPAGQDLTVRIRLDRPQTGSARAWFFFSKGALQRLAPRTR